mgnify:CR=1 FL=1
MGKTIYSDNTDINGVNYATVGENIREGAKSLTYESVGPVLEENAGTVNTALSTTARTLKAAIFHFLTTPINEVGTNIYFGETSDIPYNPVEWAKFNDFVNNVRINARIFRSVILFMFTNDSSKYGSEWGGESVACLTDEEKQKIKTFLGIS